MESKYCYGIWRDEKEKEPGFSHELISPDSRHILDQTNLDSLDAVATPGIDTLLKSFKSNVKDYPNHDWLGTRVGNKYEWMTWKQCADISENLSYGIKALKLVPEIAHEDRVWRFLGI